jgi:hypothetical protein
MGDDNAFEETLRASDIGDMPSFARRANPPLTSGDDNLWFPVPKIK